MVFLTLHLDTRREKANGAYPIKLYVRHIGKFYMAIPFCCRIDNWNGSGYTSKEPNYKIKNMRLRALFDKAERCVLDLEDSGKIRTFDDQKLKEKLESIIKGRPEKKDTFINVFDRFVDLKTKRSTIECYLQTRTHLLRYDPECTFESMNRDWLSRFEKWMTDKGMATNTRSIHLRNIRTVFNYAIDEDITALYPFKKFKIKIEATRKRALSIEQLIKLRDYPCEPHLQQYRDMFMLIFYLIGINTIDLFEARKTSISNGHFEYRREKTGRLYSIKIEPEIQNLLERYQGDNYLIDVLDRYNDYRDYQRRLNRGLQTLGPVSVEAVTGKDGKKKVGKKKYDPLFPFLTTYWARHTWATIAAYLDIPKETISAALGHELGSRVTSIYIDFDQKKIDEANRKVIDFLNSYIYLPDTDEIKKIQKRIDVAG